MKEHLKPLVLSFSLSHLSAARISLTTLVKVSPVANINNYNIASATVANCGQERRKSGNKKWPCVHDSTTMFQNKKHTCFKCIFSALRCAVMLLRSSRMAKKKLETTEHKVVQQYPICWLLAGVYGKPCSFFPNCYSYKYSSTTYLSLETKGNYKIYTAWNTE